MAASQAHLQSLTDTYQSLQLTLQDTISARQKLASQQQENLSVQKEFASLDDEADDSAIYKLVGPVLLKQEKAEAVLAVEGRLAYIDKEIERVEKTIGEMRDKSEGMKMEVCIVSYNPVSRVLMLGIVADISTPEPIARWSTRSLNLKMAATITPSKHALIGRKPAIHQ